MQRKKDSRERKEACSDEIRDFSFFAAHGEPGGFGTASAADKEEICAAGSEIEDPQVKSRRE